MLASMLYPLLMRRKGSLQPEKLYQLNVRVPKRTIEQLQEMARRDRRSATQQVIHLIEEAAARR